MHKFILLAVLILLSYSATALDLQESLTIAYSNNDDLKNNKVKFSNDIEQFPQALGQYFLPDVSASVSSSNNSTKEKSKFIASQSPSRPLNTLQKGVTLQQPIFNGGSGIAALKAAQSSFRASRGTFYAQEQQIILGLIKAYLDFYEANENYNIFESSVKNNQKQLEAMQEKLKVGEATATDVATAQAALSAAETNKFTAYTNLQSTKATFVKLFGVEPKDITMPEVPTDLPSSLEELLQKSAVLNPNIDSIKHSTAASKANELVAKGTLLPQVNFRVQSGRTYYDPEANPNISNNTNNISTTSTLSVDIPIYSKGGSQYSAIRQAKNRTRNMAIQLDTQLKQNKSDCINSWEAFNTAKSRIISTSQGVAAAEIAYNGTVQEEMVGSKSILDVLNAEEQLNKTRISKVEADKTCILAAYQIKSLLGQLTAKSLKLKVDYFSPEDEFKKTKMKIIGF